MTTIHIEHLNESFVRLNTDIGVLKEIAGRFSFRVEGYQFMTRYKAGVWDGYIRPINSKNGVCPKGLVPKVIQYIRDNSYQFTLDKNFNRFKEDIEFDYNKLNLPHEPHDYQLKAVDLFIKKKRQVILSSTGSGKSLIIYMMVHAILDAMEEGQKIIVIVPNISLVSQLFNDFKDYSVNNGWNVDENVHMIMGGKDKTPVYVTVETVDGNTYKFQGNESIKLINNQTILARDLTDDDEIDDKWLQKYITKQIH